jgi:hypothetical protein
MNRYRFAGAVCIGLFAAAAVVADPPITIGPPREIIEIVQPGEKDKKQPEKEKKVPEKKTEPETDIFTRTPTPVRDALGYNPNMIGDFQAKYSLTSVRLVGTQTITTTTTTQVIDSSNPPVTTTTTTTKPFTQFRVVSVPSAVAGVFKVADNASPLPVDRCYFTYTFYNDIRGLLNGQDQPITTTQTITTPFSQRGTFGTSTATTTTTIPGAPSFVNLHREVVGFEKTFLDGYASIEMRIPMFQQPSNLDEFRAAHMGDITILGKYAFLYNRDTGDVLSGGLAITAPTGPGIQTIDGNVHSTLLQPWFGYILNLDRWYLLAFHSAVFPTDNRDVTLLFNDVGVGYRTYIGGPDRMIRFVVPTVEAHITTPLSNRDANSPITTPDLVVLTGGLNLGLFRNSILTIGVGSPVTGPRVYGMQAFVQFNRRF